MFEVCIWMYAFSAFIQVQVHHIMCCIGNLSTRNIKSIICIGLAILVRGLQRIPDPVSLFVPNTTLLKWSFQQCGKTNSIVKAWVSLMFEIETINQAKEQVCKTLS